MPCSDPTPSQMYSSEARERKRVEAMLCGVLTIFEKSDLSCGFDNFLRAVGSECGESVQMWWQYHKAADVRRIKDKISKMSEVEKVIAKRLLNEGECE